MSEREREPSARLPPMAEMHKPDGQRVGGGHVPGSACLLALDREMVVEHRPVGCHRQLKLDRVGQTLGLRGCDVDYSLSAERSHHQLIKRLIDCDKRLAALCPALEIEPLLSGEQLDVPRPERLATHPFAS